MPSTHILHPALTIFLLIALFSGKAWADPETPSAAYPQSSTEPIRDPAERARMKAELKRLQKIQARMKDPIFELPGVIGFGIGRSEDGLLFNVLVDRSQPPPDLPEELEGVPVQAQPRNRVQLLDGLPACGNTSPCHADQQPLPVEMGNSGSWISPVGSGACTLGFKACDLETEELVFVTNSHCNQSKTSCDLAIPGAPNTFWVHPGRMDATPDGGTCLSSDDCIRIGDITGHAAPSCGSDDNYTDATKVESSYEQTSLAFRDIGWGQGGAGDPLPGDLVRKSGRTTGDTFGTISSVSMDIPVPAPAPDNNGFCCGALEMKDQIEWQPIGDTKPGDSGSALLSYEPEFEFQVVGLHWGTDGTFTYANHIDRVLAALNISLNFLPCLQNCLFSEAVEAAEKDFKAEADLLELGHRFHDEVLAESPVGRQFTQLYYQFSDEAVRVATRSPQLLERTVELLVQFAPKLEELVAKRQTAVTPADLEKVDRLLESYASQASESMKETIRTVQKQIADPQIQETLGVTVSPHVSSEVK